MRVKVDKNIRKKGSHEICDLFIALHLQAIGPLHNRAVIQARPFSFSIRKK